MALKETIHQVRQLLTALLHDLEKTTKGNEAAAQRVRTGSIEFAKVAKVFRKESIAAQRGANVGKPVKKTASKSARKKKR